MRIISLDVGDKTIGIAMSDLTGTLATGLTTIRRTSLEKDLDTLTKIVDEYTVDSIIIGLPKNMNGSLGERAQKSIDLAKILEERFQSVTVKLWDERLSTVAAEKVLISADLRREKRKKIIDMMAAVVILQNYLDSTKN
ncbi:MAG TPA: Holliday junction resolvase RuvX [Candidatus Avacidaminococcus intestinavium]|uniref:Putative pre-16S rRNA nuclease n=1 Tax=Candidatus Avacidaminococcus intestinavium TaxID=2840684 RepID=A0A9D1SM73_9FIRM|nr:Holliday junction resolvase RuvX [Candidatus Avacidaminococcus intestinavium]